MGSAVQYLFFAWVAFTVLLVLLWLLRRWENKKDKELAPAAPIDLEADHSSNAEDELPQPSSELVHEEDPRLVHHEEEYEPPQDPVEELDGTDVKVPEAESSDELPSELTKPDQLSTSHATMEDPELEQTGAEIVDKYEDNTAHEGGDTILELLDGISLPYDMVPYLHGIEEPERHAVFVTNGVDPLELGTSFADQLNQIGYNIEASGREEAVGRRGQDAVSMRIEPDASNTRHIGVSRYKDLPEGSVAVEVWVGDGPRPHIGA